MELKVFQEQVLFAVSRITIPNEAGDSASIGTGFIVRVPVRENETAFLLVSNKHVFEEDSRPILLNFHEKDENGQPILGRTKSIRYIQYDSMFYAHPDPTIDLAALNISAVFSQGIYIRSIDSSLFPSFSEPDLYAGNEVWFVGYPENRFDVTHNLPLVRRGYIASAPKVDFNNKKEFLIDAHVHRGSSGSPVFCSLQGKFKLLGVVTQTMIVNAQLQTLPTHTSVGIQQTMGLGIVIKTDRVRELIDFAMTRIAPAAMASNPPATETDPIQKK